MSTQLAILLQDALGSDFRLEHELAGGGMSRLFVATDVRLNRRVVVKVLSPDLEVSESVARFRREIELTVRLQHPHILPILTTGSAGGSLYYTTPYIEGESLRARLQREAKLPLDDVLRILKDIAGALAFAHAGGVVHRDVKPGNILLSGGQAILADFGIARAVATTATPLTGSGVRLGTPAYMPPEMWSDERADVYALGVVAYEMLCGGLPPRGLTPRQILSARGAVRGDRRRPLAALAEVIARAVEPKTAGAIGSPASFLQQLDALRLNRHQRIAIAIAAAGGVAATLLAVSLSLTKANGLGPLSFGVVSLRAADSASLDLDRAVTDRLLEWGGITVRRPESAAPAQSVRDALETARKTGLRNLVVLDATRDIGATVVRATLYDVVDGRSSRTTRAVLPNDQSPADRTTTLRTLVNALVRNDAEELPWMSPSDSSIPRLDAWRAYDGGRLAIRGWKLAAAESSFRLALSRDPQLSRAHLWLSQAIDWMDTTRRSQQRLEAQRAIDGHRHLDSRDSARSTALLAISDADYFGACQTYRHLLAHDSTDFVAWLGLGECQTLDRTVIRDARTRTGWAFRTSFESAARAYQRSGRYQDPLAQSAFSGWLLGKLSRLLFPTTNKFRAGFAVDRDTGFMGAFPYLDADTLAFAPHPIADFATRRGDPDASRIQAAVARNRDLLRGSAEEWVRQSPRDAAAFDSLATWSELSSGFGLVDGRPMPTIELLRRARALATNPAQQLRLTIAETRLLIKDGRFVDAAAKADSLLAAGAERNNQEVAGIPALAALMGRVQETVRLLPLERTDRRVALANGGSWTPPKAVADAAASLQAYASFGQYLDSVRVISKRTLDLVNSFVADTLQAARIRGALVASPLTYSDPRIIAELGAAIQPPDEVARAVFLVARSDSSGARRQLARLDSIDRGKQPGNDLPSAFRRALVSLALRDTVAATRQLDETIRTLPALDPAFIAQVWHTTSLVRALALRAELARDAGDRSTARRLASAVVAFWRHADPALQPIVVAMLAIETTNR